MNRWLLVSFAGVLAAFSSIAVSSAPSNGQALSRPGLAVLRGSASPPAPAHSIALGLLSSSADIHLDVTLKLPDPSAVTSFIASLSDRLSPNFQHFLRPSQFGQVFGPSLSDVAAVDAVLRADGLHPGQVASDRLSIPVTASASVIDRAFHVSLVRYLLPNGRAAVTSLSPPSISTSVSSYVEGIVGLSNVYEPQSMLVRARVSHEAAPRSPADVHPMTAGPTPCAAASGAHRYGLLTADQLASYYGMTTLYGQGDLGKGIHVAIVALEPNLPTDIAAYQVCYNTGATVNYIDVDGGAGSGVGTGEAALDIEDVIGLAPLATIDVYSAPEGSEYDDYSKIVNADTDQVVSISYGLCELDEDVAFTDSESAVFEQAATQGESVFAAAGDKGSTGCYGDKGTTHGSTPSVDDPASQPYVLGVGGTSIGATSESAWNDSSTSDGAGGGGVSATLCMPSYQDQSGIQGVISSYSVRDSADCGATTGYRREVPDVSADADPATGYVPYWNGSWYYEQDPDYPAQGYTLGGTSAAAPLWAAVAAVVDSSPVCSDFGSESAVQATGLYDAVSKGVVPSAFHDVTSGDNDYTPSGYSGGLYPATVGYDMASGLGTPDASMLVTLLCSTGAATPTVTAVSPTSGTAAGGTSVTITGTGFTKAAKIAFGTTSITRFSVLSPTSITATSPPESAGVVNVTVTTLAGTSVTSTADQFTYTSLPPSATTDEATSVSSDAATLSGSVNPNGSTTTCYFEYGTTSSYGSTTSPVSVGAGTSAVSKRARLTGLSANTTYDFQLVAKNAGGTTDGGNLSFTTSFATTTTNLVASPVSVVYGHEQAERLSVSVSPRFRGAPPTGTVTVKSSTGALCVITLSSGKGSCRLSPKQLEPRTYSLVATYGGSSNFKSSTSAKKKLTVVT